MTHRSSVARAIIVGDVHGCSRELDDLLEACKHSPEDRLVFTGDLVAKGPDSVGVVARARELAAKTVLGNHDHKVLQIRAALDQGERPPRASDSQHRAARDLSADAVAWLHAQPFFLRLPEHRTIVVHGGMRPDRPLEDQDPHVLITMRNLLADGTPTKKIDQGVPWASRWPGPELVVFGHDAIRGLQQYEHAIGIDTGCVYGGALTALILPERQLVSVSSRQPYLPRGHSEPKY